MNISLQWDSPQKTSLILTFTSPWTWDDFQRLSPQIADAFSSVSHRVDLVIDMTHAGHIPDKSLYHLREAYSDTTENLGQYIFMNAPESFKRIFSAADRYYTGLGGHLDFMFVETGTPQSRH